MYFHLIWHLFLTIFLFTWYFLYFFCFLIINIILFVFCLCSVCVLLILINITLLLWGVFLHCSLLHDWLFQLKLHMLQFFQRGSSSSAVSVRTWAASGSNRPQNMRRMKQTHTFSRSSAHRCEPAGPHVSSPDLSVCVCVRQRCCYSTKARLRHTLMLIEKHKQRSRQSRPEERESYRPTRLFPQCSNFNISHRKLIIFH